MLFNILIRFRLFYRTRGSGFIVYHHIRFCLDNPLIANGEHGGSVKKLDGSKTSINGELAGKKLEDDDDQGEEGDQVMNTHTIIG